MAISLYFVNVFVGVWSFLGGGSLKGFLVNSLCWGGGVNVFIDGLSACCALNMILLSNVLLG